MMVKVKDQAAISENDVRKYEMLNPLLNSMLGEMKELSKKKQDGFLNKLKVSMINKILTQIKILLSTEPTSEFISLLDEDSLPTNSDVVLILSQYQSAMNQYRGKYYRRDTDEATSRWHTKENP